MTPPLIPESHLGREPTPDRPLRLLERVRHALKARRYSFRTEQSYVQWVRRYVLYHGRRHPAQLDEREIAAFLSHLAVEKRVAAPTQNQALAALLFLYEHVLKRPIGYVDGIRPAHVNRRLPPVLTQEEVRAVLDKLTGVPRLVAVLLYGSGLRLTECLSLRVKDVDFERAELTVRAGKGGKDRRAPLPRLAMPDLRTQIGEAKEVFRRDVLRGVRVELPDAIDVKFANAQNDWRWRYVLPSARVHLREGTP